MCERTGMQGLRNAGFLHTLLINISIRMDFTDKNKEISQNKGDDGFQQQQWHHAEQGREVTIL